MTRSPRQAPGPLGDLDFQERFPVWVLAGAVPSFSLSFPPKPLAVTLGRSPNVPGLGVPSVRRRSRTSRLPGGEQGDEERALAPPLQVRDREDGGRPGGASAWMRAVLSAPCDTAFLRRWLRPPSGTSITWRSEGASAAPGQAFHGPYCPTLHPGRFLQCRLPLHHLLTVLDLVKCLSSWDFKISFHYSVIHMPQTQPM